MDWRNARDVGFFQNYSYVKKSFTFPLFLHRLRNARILYKAVRQMSNPDLLVARMAKENKQAENENHKKFAINCFNLVWGLLDKKDRTEEEDDRMVHAAHASRFHWGEIGTALEFERGEWQISRVYSAVKRPISALFHAERCLEICKDNDIGDFDISFAYEAMARAHAVAENKVECEEYIKLAEEAGEKIEKKEDKKHFFNELKSISC